MGAVVPPAMAGTPFAGPKTLPKQSGCFRMDVITCFYCKQESTRAHWERVVENKTPLHGPWSGWRMAGRMLVSPQRERITPERLAGLIWREAQDQQVSKSLLAQSGQSSSVQALPGHGQQAPRVRRDASEISDVFWPTAVAAARRAAESRKRRESVLVMLPKLSRSSRY